MHLLQLNEARDLKMRLKTFFSLCFALFGILAAPLSPARAEVSGSVEDGLRDMARQLVDKATAPTKIAVLPFPNADGTCSVLSTYIVDELTQALLSVPGSKLTVIERLQLQALIAELTIGESGLLNPATTKELGNVSGVEALVLGTITIMGDKLRINARLVATDTGRAIASAAVNVSKTSTEADLLSQRITGGSGCGMFAGSKRPPPLVSPPVQIGDETGGLNFSVQSISRGKDKKSVSVLLSVVNTNEQPAKALFLGNPASLLDNLGNEAVAQSVTGITVCHYNDGWGAELDRCWEWNKIELTTLIPKVAQPLRMRFAVAASNNQDTTDISGDLVILSGRIAVQKGDEKAPTAYSIKIPNIPLK